MCKYLVNMNYQGLGGAIINKVIYVEFYSRGYREVNLAIGCGCRD